MTGWAKEIGVWFGVVEIERTPACSSLSLPVLLAYSRILTL